MKTEKIIIRAKIAASLNAVTLSSLTESKEDGKKKRESICTLRASTCPNVTLESVTDTGRAFAQAYAPRMAATALKTIYSASGHPHVYDLYIGVCGVLNGESAVNPDSLDVISVAYAAILDLIAAGMVNSAFTFGYYRSYVYQAVNQYVHGERRAYNEKTKTSKEESVVDEYGAIALDTILSFWKYVESRLSPRVDRERAKRIFLLRFADGMTERETAEKLGVDSRVVHRITEYIRAIADTASGYEYLRGMLEA